MTNDPDLGAPKRPPPTIDLDPSEVTMAEARPNTESSAAHDAKPEEPPADRDQSARDRETFRSQRSWRDNASNALTPALSGATAAALILIGAWLLGLSGDNRSQAPVADGAGTADLTARMAKVEATLATIATAPSAVANDPASSRRIEQTEASLKSMTADIATLRGDIAKTATSIKDAAAGQRSAQPSFDAAPLEQRMVQIEATQQATTQAVQQAGKPFDDAALRRALAASALDGAVRSGEGFADLLTSAKAMTPTAALQVLDAFAARGVPDDATLSRELTALLPQLSPSQPKQAATTAGSTSGILDRLQESASRLVKIDRVDQANPEQPASTAKLAAAARGNDITAAKIALVELPAAQRAPAQAWLDRVQARDAARDAARQFAAAQITALSAPVR